MGSEIVSVKEDRVLGLNVKHVPVDCEDEADGGGAVVGDGRSNVEWRRPVINICRVSADTSPSG